MEFSKKQQSSIFRNSISLLILASAITTVIYFANAIKYSANTSSVEAVNIPNDRKINWQPGIPGGIPNYPLGVSVANFGANGSDQSDDTAAFRSAIAAATPNSAIRIPAGTYYLNSSIVIGKSNIALRGEGFNNTKLIYTAAGGNIFVFNTNSGSCGTSSGISVTGGLSKDSNTVTVSNSSSFNAGRFAVLREDNDPELFTCGGSSCTPYSRSIGQVFRIRQVVGNNITFEKPLYLTYRSALNPLLCVNNMTEKSGIENLTITRRQTGSSGHNVSFANAAYSWLKNVLSENTITSHVYLDKSLGNEIRGSYFNGSFEHGSGGKGYGVAAQNQATDNLIEDNIFNFLRHSMLVSIGATGNVFGYNYSRNPYTSQSTGWLSGDLLSHGIYAYQNLFEGNTVQQALMDNAWGSNGPSTYFRNRIEKSTENINDNNLTNIRPEDFSYMQADNNNHFPNFIGNELGKPNTYTNRAPLIKLAYPATSIETCNYAYERRTFWGSSDCNMPASYYLTSKPSFLGSLPWPVLGGDISPNSNIIPAQKRYNDRTFIPATSPSLSITPTSTPNSPTPTTASQGDTNADGQINILDFQLLSNTFGKSLGQEGYNPNADFNNDNVINILDFQILSNNFGQ